MKNYFGNTSKGMESEATVRMVRRGPDKIGAYWRWLVMDDDTVTPAHLKEANPSDTKCKGRLCRDLSGIYCFADPSHRKRVVKNKFYASSLSSEQAAKLGKDFGYFVNQNKNGTLEEFRRKRFVILRHNCGDHSLCGSWCKAKRALDANKPYNAKSIV